MTDHPLDDELNDDLTPELRALLADDGEVARLVRTRLVEAVDVPTAMHDAHVRFALAEFDRLNAPSAARRSPARSRTTRRSLWARWTPALVGVAGVAAIGVLSFGSISGDGGTGTDAAAPEQSASKVAESTQRGGVMAPSAPDATTAGVAATDAGVLHTSPAGSGETTPAPLIVAESAAPEAFAVPEANDSLIATAGDAGASYGPAFTDSEQLIAYARTLDVSTDVIQPRQVGVPQCGVTPAATSNPINWNGIAATLYVAANTDGSRTLTVIASDCTTLISLPYEP